jgi:transposase
MKKHKQRPPDPKDIKDKHIMVTTKIDLSSILGYNSNTINDLSKQEKDCRIQDAVQRVNHIVFHTTHFMELYLLHLFHNKEPKPDITLDFIGLCMRTVAHMPSQSGRRPSQKTLDILKVLKNFYSEHYEPLLGPDPQKVDLLHISYILQYEEVDILKNIKNNIWMHFTDYCKEWVNKEFELKTKLAEIDENKEFSEEQKKLTKRNLSIQMRLVKEDLLGTSGSTYTSDPKYHQWLSENKQHVITKTIFNEDPSKNHIHYDIKANTLDYLFSFFYVVDKLRKWSRNIQCIPIRSSFIPKYITLDTASVIMLMVDKDSGKYLKKIKDSRNIIWSTFFNTKHKVFRRKDYNFFSMIKTDGVGASIILYRSDKTQDKLPKDVESSKEYYVDEMRVENISDVKIVGIDVGKDDLLHCTDGTNFFRYTANQRRLETRKKKYMKINDRLKKETHIEGLNVKGWETTLSVESRYTMDFEGFKNYLKIKLPLYSKLEEYYYEPLRRKLRWNTYINTQKSESKMINNFKSKFGSDVVIGIGDFDQSSYHMKYKEPTKGKGLRKVLRQAGYEVLLVDEFRTSCKCHNCHCDTEKFHGRKNHKPITKYQKENGTYQEIIQVHGLLRCSSANGCGSLWNRDVNGCLNIRMLAVDALSGRERHKTFQRTTINKNSCELNDSL